MLVTPTALTICIEGVNMRHNQNLRVKGQDVICFVTGTALSFDRRCSCLAQ